MVRITNAQVSLIVSKALGQDVQGIQPVVDPGEVNETFVVDADGVRFIARINETSELERFKKEAWCIDRSKEAGVPVADVISLGVHKQFSYMIQTLLPGTRGDEVGLARPEIWRTIGHYAQLVHSIKVAGFGEKLEDITSGSAQQWQTYILENIESLGPSSALAKAASLKPAQLMNMSSWFEALKSRDFKFGLSHGDLSLDNVIVGENTVYLIDWGSAEAQIVPHYDFGVILADSLGDESEEFEQFLIGYGMVREDYLNIKEDISSLMVLISTDKVRWAMDRNPVKVAQFVEQLHTRYNQKEAS